MSLPPNTLHFGKLLPSTFTFTFPDTKAAVPLSPFPPPNTFPVIETVFEDEYISLIFICTLPLIVPKELPPYIFPYTFKLLLLSFILISVLPFTFVDEPRPPPNKVSVLV